MGTSLHHPSCSLSFSHRHKPYIISEKWARYLYINIDYKLSYSSVLQVLFPLQWQSWFLTWRLQFKITNSFWHTYLIYSILFSPALFFWLVKGPPYTFPPRTATFTMPSRLSDAFRAHPVNIHQKHLDFTSLQKLPDSFKWTQLDDHPSGDLLISESVPVIDLLHPNALQNIGRACKTWGVFQVVNHGIPTSLLDSIESTSKSLFSLPIDQKLKAARSPDGVSGYGFARISSFFSKLMWSEGFTIVGSPIEHFRQLWPHDFSKFCDIIEEYEKQMQKLAGRLMWLMLASLGISKEDLNWACPKGKSRQGSAALQMNCYPVCPDPDKAMGLAAHTDSTLLTILYQNSTSGLQVLKEGTGWVTVPPIPGGLVINVGDLLHILSNGLYPSVLHRAVVNRTKQRLSVAYLYGPPSSVQISPLSKLVGPSQPPLYRSVTWNEYLGTKAKHFNKALSCVRVCALLNGLVDVNDNNRVKVG